LKTKKERYELVSQHNNELLNSKHEEKEVGINAQGWLDKNYPFEERNKIKSLDINEKNLVGDLVLNDFVELEKLDCSVNQLTSLEISNCQRLESLRCSFNNLYSLNLVNLTYLEEVEFNDNYLTSFDFSTLNPEKLVCLNISDNNFGRQDLSSFSNFINLNHL